MDTRPDDLHIMATMIQNTMLFHECVDIVIRADGTVEVWGDDDGDGLACTDDNPAGLDYLDEDSNEYHYIEGFLAGLRKAGVLPPASGPTFSPGDTP